MGLSEHKRREYFNLPNYLTMGRIALVPVVMVLLMQMRPGEGREQGLTLGLITATVFIIAAVSDLVDGYYARKHQINSLFGKYFDPLADKLMILAAMIMLIPLGRIPAWVVVLFLGREITITALRGIASAEDLEIPADSWGKKKTVFQSIAVGALIIYYPLLGINIKAFGEIFLYLALAMALFSGFRYCYRFSEAIKNRYSV